jgi:hypothetical protein
MWRHGYPDAELLVCPLLPLVLGGQRVPATVRRLYDVRSGARRTIFGGSNRSGRIRASVPDWHLARL